MYIRMGADTAVHEDELFKHGLKWDITERAY